MSAQCPVGVRKTARTHESPGPGVERVGDRWLLRSHDSVRAVLKEKDATIQAGFNAETLEMARPGMRKPVLYAAGEEHRTQRSAIARYFAPAVVTKRYRGWIEERADALVADAVAAGEVELSDLTLRYAVDVAAQVVGLTESDPDKLATHLEAFFVMAPIPADAGASRWQRVTAGLNQLRSLPPMITFDRKDVRPAVTARRAQPREDVISHLIASGYTDQEILIECITYAAAGMITTREFISMATWHLLENPAVRDRFLAADAPERRALLEEILRLEPVVGHLYRRTTRALTVHDAGRSYDIPAGALVDLWIRAANADEDAVGADGLRLCPGREVADGVRPEAMSFGDGAHRCPGHALALEESEIMLARLLAHPIRLVSAPTIAWDELISGYAVRSIRVAFDPT